MKSTKVEQHMYVRMYVDTEGNLDTGQHNGHIHNKIVNIAYYV